MSTRRHVHEETFPVAPDRLFALLYTPSAIRGWWGAARAVVLAEPGGVWAATWGADEDDPDYITAATIREFDPPRRMVSRNVEGKLDFTITLILEPADGSTRLTQRIDAASGLGGVFGKLADSLVERAQGRTVRANLETLAEWLAEHPRT